MSFRYAARLLLLLVPSLSWAAATAPVPGPDATVLTVAQLPVESFLELDKFDSIKISPDGVHLAATVPNEG